MRSIKTAGPNDSWQYCSYSLEDLLAEPDDRWIIFDEDMSFGTYHTENDARRANELYLEFPEDELEFITVAEFKSRVTVNPGLEMEPGPDCIE